MSNRFSVDSILNDPTLMWDRRCSEDFTISGREIHYQGNWTAPIPRKIEKQDKKIIRLYQSCGLSMKEYWRINKKLQELYEKPLVSIEDRTKYLIKIKNLLSQLSETMNTAQRNMACLANQLTEEKRKRYYAKLDSSWEELGLLHIHYDKEYYGRPIRQAQKDLYQAATECRTLLLDQMQQHSSDIPKELYMGMVTDDLKEWKDLLDKLYHPETTNRQEYLAQLKARKDFIDPALSKILKQADDKNEPIHEGWREVRDFLNHDFSQAKFYTDSKDENLAELSELLQSNPQEYREKSLLYGQKLIDQKAHQEAVDHAIKWIESPPQGTSWEDASQMINLFMHANEKNADAAKFLHALNRWTKDQLNCHASDIPKELYMRMIKHDLKEWQVLLDKIYQPEATDSDRQECFNQLQAKKDYFDPALSEILKQTDAPGESIHEGWRNVQHVLDRDFSRARFYADSKDENLAELDELFQSNPQEYRKKSLLYEQKLLNRGAHQEAVDHAIQWMESLSQDASWEDVAQMVNLFMQANEKSADAAKFLHALNCWTKDQLDLHVDSETSLPLGEGAEYIAIAKGMLYSNTDRELSFEAAKYYQIWQKAKPDDPIPKVLLVHFHIANAEWDKSKQIIAKLPEQYSVPLRKNMAIHMFNVYSLPLDAAEMVILRSAIPFARRKILPGSMADQTLDVVSSAVQGIFHQVLRRCWLPYCIKDLSPLSEEPLSTIEKTSLGVFAAQTMSPFVLPPIFAFLTPNLEMRRTYLQPIIEFSGPILGITNSGILAYEAYKAKASLTKPAISLTSTTVSLLGRSVLRFNKDLSPTKRGMIMTSLKVLSLAQDIQAIYANQPAIRSVASYVTSRYRAQPLCSKVENYLSKVPGARNRKVIIAASATGVVAYGLFFDFPRARTGAVLEEATRLCHEQKYLEATDLLSAAKEWFSVWSDRLVIQQYADCIPFFEKSLKIGNNTEDKEWLEDALSDVDKTIETLEKSEYYSLTLRKRPQDQNHPWLALHLPNSMNAARFAFISNIYFIPKWVKEVWVFRNSSLQ